MAKLNLWRLLLVCVKRKAGGSPQGVDITGHSIRERIRMGIAHIPSDRHKHGLILDYTLQENMILKYTTKPLRRKRSLKPGGHCGVY